MQQTKKHPYADSDDDNESFSAFEEDDRSSVDLEENRLYYDPNAVVEGVHNIPGSPWAKPPIRPNSRPKETLPVAKYVATLSIVFCLLWVGTVIFFALWNYKNGPRMVVEICMGVLCFLGTFSNSYFTVSSIFKACIPSRALRTNTRYSSVVPEEKSPLDEWLSVTIQIPVYKEPIHTVLLPTLESCVQARNFYIQSTGCKANICVCDDGMMVLLKNNFAAAEMLWETITKTKGKILKLSRLLKVVPRPSRQHLKGLNCNSVYEVFHRMLFYYHFQIGFVARSTWDRPGKSKKASNLNAHMRLVWGAKQQIEDNKSRLSFDQVLHQMSHNSDGSRFIMFGNDISVGELLVITDANSRMAESVIHKTVPEFLNDPGLGFTQHATKTLDDQKDESFFVNLLSTYRDGLSQGQNLLGSILGCHPPLMGHAVFLRSEAVRQCGRVRTLRKAQRWLSNIGIPFLSVDQVGLRNLQDHSFTEYWSTQHVDSDFELMIHLYNLGFDGRYVSYPACEFEQGVSRTFDEEAARHRRLSLGAHELLFHPINSWLVRSPFSPVFQTMMKSKAISSSYKIFLISTLFHFCSGGVYLFVFTVAATARILGHTIQETSSLIFVFNSASILFLSMVTSFLVSSFMMLIALIKVRLVNPNLLFPNYRKSSIWYLVYKQMRYSMLYRFLFYSIMPSYYFLGSMDHLLQRYCIVTAISKYDRRFFIGRCIAFKNTLVFNCSSWLIGFYLLWLCFTVILSQEDWDWLFVTVPKDWLYLALFIGPALLLAVLMGLIPLLLNPYVLGWPFYPPLCRAKNEGEMQQIAPRGSTESRISSRMLQRKMRKSLNDPDAEVGSVTTFSSHWAQKKYSKD